MVVVTDPDMKSLWRRDRGVTFDFQLALQTAGGWCCQWLVSWVPMCTYTAFFMPFPRAVSHVGCTQTKTNGKPVAFSVMMGADQLSIQLCQVKKYCQTCCHCLLLQTYVLSDKLFCMRQIKIHKTSKKGCHNKLCKQFT